MKLSELVQSLSIVLMSLFLLIAAGCGETRSTPEATSSPISTSAGEAPIVSLGAAPAPVSAAPAAASASSSAGSTATASSGTGGRPIAAWLDDADVNAEKWKFKPFTMEGVYQRTWLHQSGVYVGNEHPGHRVLVVNIADSVDASPRDTLQCWTSLLTAPTDLKPGDRLRVEGKVSHLAGHGSRLYLAFLSECAYSRL